MLAIMYKSFLIFCLYCVLLKHLTRLAPWIYQSPLYFCKFHALWFYRQLSLTIREGLVPGTTAHPQMPQILYALSRPCRQLFACLGGKSSKKKTHKKKCVYFQRFSPAQCFLSVVGWICTCGPHRCRGENEKGREPETSLNSIQIFISNGESLTGQEPGYIMQLCLPFWKNHPLSHKHWTFTSRCPVFSGFLCQGLWHRELSLDKVPPGKIKAPLSRWHWPTPTHLDHTGCEFWIILLSNC